MHKKVFATLLVVAFLIGTLAALQGAINVSAAPTMKTYAVADAIPNPIGVGEHTLIKMGISEAAFSASLGWSGITVTIVDPDGKSETLGPFTTDSTGSTYTLYTPTKVGNYTITTHVPNQTITTGDYTPSERGTKILNGTVLLASENTVTLEVLESRPQEVYPGHALPTEYWSRPIDPQLREWATIAGNWVERPFNSLVKYQENAPETPHILWNMPEEMGGLSGGLFGEDQIPAASYAGDAYEGRFSTSVVINGVLYYNTAPTGTYAQVGVSGIQAVDLHTGEKLWFKSGPVLSFGQTMFYPSYNVNGVYNYLWSVNGANYTAYSPTDGSFQFMFTNMPSGFRTFGPNGEILIYQVNYAAGWMALWNSSLAGLQNAVIGTPSYGSWSFGVLGLAPNAGRASNPTNALGEQTGTAFPVTRCLNGALPQCYSWNVTIPKNLPISNSFGATGRVVEDQLIGIFYNQTLVRIWSLPLSGHTATRTAAINTEVVQPTFDKSWTPPSEWSEGSNTIHWTGVTNYIDDPVYGEGVIALWDKELTTHYGFSAKTGNYLWATESENYLDQYGWGNAEHTWYFAYGKLYSVGIAGILYAYDLKTGATDWTYTMTDPYAEPITGENWWGWIDLIAAGKIYMGTLEHSANNPIPRGGPYVCVNATDGSEIFRINGLMRETRWGGNPVMGDSIIAGFDTYDLQIYAMGKGPTQTTIVSPTTSTANGQQFIIQGSVSDISPGTANSKLAMRFPNGVPAVSDASQAQWMMYVYKQFEQPTNCTGVPMVINVVDANGNYRTVGTTTSDTTGHYAFAWQPDIAGAYTVYASFAGSKAYYGSQATATFYADAPVATATPMPTPAPSAADLYFLPAIIGVIIAILVVGAVLALLVTKKP